MIVIDSQDILPPDAIDFVKSQWPIADKVHFGHEVEWKKEKKALIAKDDVQIVGVLEYTIQAGVMYIDEIIIAHDQQGKGIGKMLMEHVEEIATNDHLHKIYLDTGATWPAVKFYEALGYIKTGDLPKHLAGQDYVIFSKFL